MGALTREAAVRTEAFQNLKYDLEARLASVEGERDEMRIKIKTMKDDFSKERAAFATTKSLLDLERNTKIKESEEWQEVAMNTKRDSEQVVKRVTLAHQELEAQITTLELTKQAMQKEAEVKAVAMANTRVEYEEKVAAVESERFHLQKKAKDGLEGISREKAELEAKLAQLDIEKSAKQREAEEWQEVAMDTKRQADEAARKNNKLMADLEAEISTLEATKLAMQKEAEVKAQATVNLKTDVDDRIRSLEADVRTYKEQSERTTKRMAALDEEKASTEKEAEEWQEVAINTKREGEDRVLELEQSLNQAETEKTALRDEIARLKTQLEMN